MPETLIEPLLARARAFLLICAAALVAAALHSGSALAQAVGDGFSNPSREMKSDGARPFLPPRETTSKSENVESAVKSNTGANI
jgi:hypothetical protein